MFSRQNTLVSPLLITWIGEISSKATKTLGFLRRNLAFALRSTKEVAYKTLVRPKLEYAVSIWSPHSKLQINQIEKVQRTEARWTCRRWRNTSSVGEMLDELEWPSLEAWREQSSLLLFHKIHCGAVSIEKDKYMTPAHSLKTMRSSHSARYRRHQTYSDALKNSFPPELEYAAPIWSPHSKLQINQIEKIQRTEARWTCRRWRNTSSVGEMLDELEWPSLEA